MTVHPRVAYARRLSALDHPDTVPALLTQVGRRRGWWHGQETWVRLEGRLTPGRAAYASMVFEMAGPPGRMVHVSVFESQPEATHEGAAYAWHELLGWLRICPADLDPDLPGVGVLLAGPDPATIVRYRPGRRCTLRVEAKGRVRYAKVFADPAAGRLHQEAEDIWAAGERGELGFRVARPDHWDAAHRTLWLNRVEGSPLLEHLQGPGARALAARLGRAAGSIPQARLEPRLRFHGPEQMERSVAYGRELGSLLPDLAPAVDALLRQLDQLALGYLDRDLRPIHGAPHPGQWLVDGRRLGLVDFDRVALGHPELDAATFIGELTFEDQLGSRTADLTKAFLTGYRAVAGPLDPTLFAAYLAHKMLAKALRCARSLGPLGGERAQPVLAQALITAPRPKRALVGVPGAA